MSERSQKAFIEAMVQYPEMDDDERMDEFEDDAIFRSSTIDLLDSVGTPDFKFNYPILIKDVLSASFNNQQLFCHKAQERIGEVYDFVFSEIIEVYTNQEINNFLDFMKFLEYDNIIFLSFVWHNLNVELLKLDIDSFCNSNYEKIMREVEEQLETHEQNELISIFLRTYYKSGFIKWFIEQSKMNKISIILEILEREGKLNG